MENDQRLTPLPVISDLQPTNIDYSSGYSSSYDDVLDGKRSIRQYISVIIKRLPIILAITILVTAAAAFYMYQQPSQYSATTTMTIEPRKQPATRKNESININFGGDQTYYNTQLKLMHNQDLMRNVVVSLGLHREPNLFGDSGRGLLAGLRSLFSGGQKPAETDNSLPVITTSSNGDEKVAEVQLTPEESRRADAYSGRLIGGLKVEQTNQTNIVNVTVVESVPVLTSKVANKVAELFIEEDQLRETQGARKAYEDLGKSIVDLEAAIVQQESDLIAEMKSSNLPLQEKGGELRAVNLQALLGQWRDAQLEVSKLQANYSAANEASRTGDILAVIGDNVALNDARSQNIKRQADFEKRIEEIDNKIDEKEQKKQELLTKYTLEYAPVKAVIAELEEVKAQRARIVKENTERVKVEGKKLIEDTQREVLASLRAQLVAAQERVGRAAANFEREATKAGFEGQAEMKLISLKNKLTQNRSLLDTYVQRQKEQELALQTERPENIKIQNRAVTPSGPIGPNRTRNIMVAMLLALAAGIGLAFLLDYLDDSVRSSDDISRHLGLPTLALIPHYNTTDKRKLLPGKNGGGAVPPNAMVTMDEKNSPMAEAYRHLRTSLLFSSAGKPPQTILVTSSQPSEGKTTTAINTAITLAQSGVDVVIIDCDLRRPRLHTHFGLENSAGLTNYLSGDKTTENLIRTYPDLPKLKIITSGPIPPNPAELLSSNEMRNLLTFLSGKFKHVIIDSPPAISFTDASILATLVDGVVLVAMANKSSIHLMRQFKQRVSNIGARIYGVVLNGIKAGSTEYYYYGSGYYNYYSKSHADDSTPVMGDDRSEPPA
jgi:capsular exopolysaccharide synthesis family protein